jgi:hypothetical protein
VATEDRDLPPAQRDRRVTAVWRARYATLNSDVTAVIGSLVVRSCRLRAKAQQVKRTGVCGQVCWPVYGPPGTELIGRDHERSVVARTADQVNVVRLPGRTVASTRPVAVARTVDKRMVSPARIRRGQSRVIGRRRGVAGRQRIGRTRQGAQVRQGVQSRARARAARHQRGCRDAPRSLRPVSTSSRCLRAVRVSAARNP